MASSNGLLESLERTIDEIDALQTIYGSTDADDDDGHAFDEGDSCSFSVVSQTELAMARSKLETCSIEDTAAIPELELEVRFKHSIEGISEKGAFCSASLRFRLPPGYPDVSAKVSVMSMDGLQKAGRELISDELNDLATSQIGQESLLVLIEAFKEKIVQHLENQATEGVESEADTDNLNGTTFGRRWIWVHHITNTDRRKSICSEAREHNLKGYLKYGYPGVIIVEGTGENCDAFVRWVKGNKSRPGGFGRNWGHYVRGHVDLESIDQCRLQKLDSFDEMEDLALFGNFCKENGLEDEFLEFVMQHRGSASET